MARRVCSSFVLTALPAILSGCHATHAAVSQAPYPCHAAVGSITIDGKLDEPAWEKAEKITKFHPLGPATIGKLPATTARLLWNDRFIYVAIECTDDDVWSYSRKPDDELWNGDVGEFFFKPSEKDLTYYEFVVAPNGTLFDARYPSRGAGGYQRFKRWPSGAKVATTIGGTDDNWRDTDRGYVIEVAIPLSAFEGAPGPADGVTWTFAVFRYDYSKSYEDPLLLMSIPESLHHGYHYYEGYQRLLFKGAEK